MCTRGLCWRVWTLARGVRARARRRSKWQSERRRKMAVCPGRGKRRETAAFGAVCACGDAGSARARRPPELVPPKRASESADRRRHRVPRRQPSRRCVPSNICLSSSPSGCNIPDVSCVSSTSPLIAGGVGHLLLLLLPSHPKISPPVGRRQDEVVCEELTMSTNSLLICG